jgi:hypothetical protein
MGLCAAQRWLNLTNVQHVRHALRHTLPYPLLYALRHAIHSLVCFELFGLTYRVLLSISVRPELVEGLVCYAIDLIRRSASTGSARTVGNELFEVPYSYLQ